MTGANSFVVLPPEELGKLLGEVVRREVLRVAVENATPKRPTENERPTARDTKALLTAGDVAALVGFTTRTIRRSVLSGAFPAPIKLTGKRAIRWRRSDVEGWLANREGAK